MFSDSKRKNDSAKKIILADIYLRQKQREVLLSENFNDLATDTLQLQYIKAYVHAFLENAFADFKSRPIEGFPKEYHQLLFKIEAANELVAIDTAISHFSLFLKQWKGCFVEGSIEESFKEIARQINQMTNLLHNLKFYSKFGINMHSAAHTKGEKTQKYYKRLNKGLPVDVKQKIKDNPNDICIMYVSGSGINNYGHALMFLGEAGFIHVDTPYNYPKYMSIEQFNQYLAALNKVVLGIQKIPLSNINEFILKLDQLCQEKWLWLGIKHNCLTFCHDAVILGGYNPGKQDEFKSLKLNLPIDWFTRAKQEHLLTEVISNKSPVTTFNENILKSSDIVSIAAIDFTPIELIKFISYVINNMDTVLKLQAEIVHNEPDEIDDFVNVKMNLPDHEVAVKKIKFKLDDIIFKMNNQYKVIYEHVIASPLFNDLIQKIDPALKASLEKISFETEITGKLFSAVRLSENASIQQDDAEHRPRNYNI